MAIVRTYKSWGRDFWELWNSVVMDAEMKLARDRMTDEVLPYSIAKSVSGGTVLGRRVEQPAVVHMELIVFSDKQSKEEYDRIIELTEQIRFHSRNNPGFN